MTTAGSRRYNIGQHQVKLPKVAQGILPVGHEYQPRLRIRISTTPSCFAIHPFINEGVDCEARRGSIVFLANIATFIVSHRATEVHRGENKGMEDYA